MAQPQTGSVEWSIGQGGYGGDLEQDPITGDIKLVVDTVGNPAATLQRITRLILTTPRAFDSNLVAYGSGDDPVNPDYGGGLGASVGENFTPRLENAIAGAIKDGLALDPYIAPSPLPTVSVASPSRGAMIVSVTCSDVLGNQIVLADVGLPIAS